MKFNFTYIFLISIFLQNTNLFAQKNIDYISGNLSFLSSNLNIKVTYNYDELKVGKFTEKEYIKSKVFKLNSKGDHQGDLWLKYWIKDRVTEYQPAFEKALNQCLKKANISIKETNVNAKYTLMVKTTFTEPGFFAYKVSKPSIVNIEFIFYETNNPDIVLGKVLGFNFRGKGMDASIRITRSYGKAGRQLGKFLLETIKK